jgi:hypothetical protein
MNSLSQSQLLELVALALSVGNGNNDFWTRNRLHASAINAFRSAGFTEEQVNEVLDNNNQPSQQ